MGFSDAAVTVTGSQVAIPPRGVLAIAWLISGVTTQGKIAKLVGCHRNSLLNGDEFKVFRAEWDRLKGKVRRKVRPTKDTEGGNNEGL